MKSSSDIEFMKEAIEISKGGLGRTSPNPLVGAVIVKGGRIIGRGFHERYGRPHAERNALASLTQSAKGATMYVTLEPCCHHGKQPPCTDAIINAGIGRVVIGSDDPNPLVSGKGIAILQAHGIKVEKGLLKGECDKLNEIFFHYIRTGRPFTALKYAMTMDGKIAAYTGASKWITEETARTHAHTLRHRFSSIMVGVQTVISDNPALTCRIPGGTNPIRVICDSDLRTPLSSQIVSSAREVPTIIATCCIDKARQQPYKEAGCKILIAGTPGSRIDLRMLMELLGRQKIDSVLIEGGATLNWSAVEAGIVQKVFTYISPKLLGGQRAMTPVGGQGFCDPGKALKLANPEVLKLGDDFLITSDVIQRGNTECLQE